MGKKILEMLEDDDIYACSACKTHLSAVKHLISKRFNGGSGPAYLIRNVYLTFLFKEECQQRCKV